METATTTKIQRAIELGFEHGYDRFYPGATEAPTGWLSGEWGGESISELLGSDASDEECEAFEAACDRGWQSAADSYIERETCKRAGRTTDD